MTASASDKNNDKGNWQEWATDKNGCKGNQQKQPQGQLTKITARATTKISNNNCIYDWKGNQQEWPQGQPTRMTASRSDKRMTVKAIDKNFYKGKQQEWSQEQSTKTTMR